MESHRIVSLIASATEMVCALGLEDQLVGRSHECDFPDSVRRLPQLTSPKFEVEGTSYEIDQRVKAIVEGALGVYRVDADMLERLQPTHIITQTQCEVCAVSLKDVEQAVCKITSSRPVIVPLEPNSLSDIWRDIRKVGAALGRQDRAEQEIYRLTSRMKGIERRSRALQSKPTVAYVEWIDPLMTGGNWMPELIEMAGGVNLFGEAGKHSPWLKWGDLLESDPDVIFVAPCGFDIDRTMKEMSLLDKRAEWERLRAVQTKRIFVADGNQYFNRPGPRIVESLEILAETLHPNLFDFSHKGTGWVSYDSP
jgi:iron complex transport system substrate-binding protein